MSCPVVRVLRTGVICCCILDLDIGHGDRYFVGKVKYSVFRARSDASEARLGTGKVLPNAWQNALYSFRPGTFLEAQRWGTILKLLILHGADPNAYIERYHRITRRKGQQRRNSALYVIERDFLSGPGVSWNAQLPRRGRCARR